MGDSTMPPPIDSEDMGPSDCGLNLGDLMTFVNIMRELVKETAESRPKPNPLHLATDLAHAAHELDSCSTSLAYDHDQIQALRDRMLAQLERQLDDAEAISSDDVCSTPGDISGLLHQSDVVSWLLIHQSELGSVVMALQSDPEMADLLAKAARMLTGGGSL